MFVIRFYHIIIEYNHVVPSFIALINFRCTLNTLSAYIIKSTYVNYYTDNVFNF